MGLRCGARLPVTRSEGPGARFALWLQGCSLGCPGCCNPHLFDPAGGTEVDVEVLCAEVLAVGSAIEGLTLLGGEPFEQAEPAAELARRVRAHGLSVVVFSGYTREELEARPDARGLLAATDLLVDGRFDARRPERARRWVGSTNQRFHYLTARYGPEIERPGPGEPLRSVEVHVDAEGRVQLSGWPEPAAVRALRGR